MILRLQEPRGCREVVNEVMELAIEPGQEPGTYTVRVLRSLSSDQPAVSVTLDVDVLVASLPRLESSVLASSVATRRVMTERETVIQLVGSKLFGAVFSESVGSAYRASVAVASERGRSLQIALRLNAPGLAAVPWEALFDPVAGVYLSRKEPLVRWVPGPHDPAPVMFEPPLRILGMIAAPRGLPVLDVAAEKHRLEEALRTQIDSGRVELTWLDEASWHGVHGKLLERQWHVLHFVGHGGYDDKTDEGLLVLVDSDGRADYVPASRLADLLDEAEPTPRLVVLNSCESGATSYTDLFSGTAAALVRSGIHAVAAMQFAITDTAAIAFSRAFYAALANGRPVGEAVRSGRIGILGTGRDTLEWVTPVLYLRGDDTALLDATRPASVAHPDETKPAHPAQKPQSSPPPHAPVRIRGRNTAAIVAAIAVAAGAAAVFVPRAMGPQPSSEPSAPSIFQLSVPADRDWTPTEVYCSEGDTFVLTATGHILHEDNPNSTVTPDGLADPSYHQYNVLGLPDAATAGLIGSLDREQQFFFVGSAANYTCPRAGQLYLGINDRGLTGNSGAWTASIQVEKKTR
jgi:CHAT domain